MAAQPQATRWVTLVLSCIVVTVAGLGIVAVAPALHDSSAAATGRPGSSNGSSADQQVDFHQPIALAPESYPPLPMDQMVPLSQDSRFARYDNIVVEVKQDGTLRVLGERMGVGDFRLLLSEQLREKLQTMVTIRPDGNCLFRHVGPVISICEEVGIPHQTQPRVAPDSIGPPPGGPV